MKNTFFSSAVCSLATAGLLLGTQALGADACCNLSGNDTFTGRWALNLPNGGAGWLGVEKQADGTFKSSILWGGGSVLPTDETKIENGALVVVRKSRVKKDGKNIQNTETITAKREGDALTLTTRTVDSDGNETGKADFTGKIIPPVPPTPDLAQVKFGTPIPLLNSKDMSGWQAMNEQAPNCWSVSDGVLSNRVKGPDGQKRHGTNIRTVQTFEDFKLSTDVRMLPDGNSGIYLRGIYEIQMSDSYGKPVDSHNMGALYSRITPSSAAEKPAGEWQHLDITLVDRHLTVVLNGVMIIDNQPVLGCTGGAITSDEFKPGPIYLQGDHSDVDYRNMILTPVVKN